MPEKNLEETFTILENRIGHITSDECLKLLAEAGLTSITTVDQGEDDNGSIVDWVIQNTVVLTFKRPEPISAYHLINFARIEEE